MWGRQWPISRNYPSIHTETINTMDSLRADSYPFRIWTVYLLFASKKNLSVSHLLIATWRWAGIAQSVQWLAMDWTSGYWFPAGIGTSFCPPPLHADLGPILALFPKRQSKWSWPLTSMKYQKWWKCGPIPPLPQSWFGVCRDYCSYLKSMSV
jgi:hypothetical protein